MLSLLTGDVLTSGPYIARYPQIGGILRLSLVVFLYRAGDGIRTHDLLLGKDAIHSECKCSCSLQTRPIPINPTDLMSLSFVCKGDFHVALL
jgi:hypothetical protein